MVRLDITLETVSPHGSIWHHIGDGVTTWLYFTSRLVAGKIVVWTRLGGQTFHFSLDTNCSWYDEDCKLTSNHEEQPRRFVVSHPHPVLYSLSYIYEYRVLIDFILMVSTTHKLGNRRTRQPIIPPPLCFFNQTDFFFFVVAATFGDRIEVLFVQCRTAHIEIAYFVPTFEVTTKAVSKGKPYMYKTWPPSLFVEKNPKKIC